MNAYELAECQSALRHRKLSNWNVTVHSSKDGYWYVIWNMKNTPIAMFGRHINRNGWWAYVYELDHECDQHICTNAVAAMNEAINVWERPDELV